MFVTTNPKIICIKEEHVWELTQRECVCRSSEKAKSQNHLHFHRYYFSNLIEKQWCIQFLGDSGGLKGSHFYTRSEMETRFPRPLANPCVTKPLSEPVVDNSRCIWVDFGACENFSIWQQQQQLIKVAWLFSFPLIDMGRHKILVL